MATIPYRSPRKFRQIQRLRGTRTGEFIFFTRKKLKRKSFTKTNENERYLTTRKELNDIETNQSNLFDKYLLTLSSSFLAFSLTFFWKKENFDILANKDYFISSSLFFMFAVLSTLLSLYGSFSCCAKNRAELDYYYLIKNEVIGKYSSLWHCIIPRLNTFSFLSFISGIISLILFAASNL